MEGTNSKTVEREIYNMRKYKWLIIYVLLMAGILIASKTLFLNAYIPSDSMNPTLKRGDLVFSLRTATEYNRYDIAIFESPDESSVLYIKRIIGLPGDEVDIKNGIVYVNGNEIDDSYIIFLFLMILILCLEIIGIIQMIVDIGNHHILLNVKK